MASFACLGFFSFFETWWHLKRQSASYHFHVPMYPSKLLSTQIPQVWYKALHCNKQGYWAGLVWNALRFCQILHFPAKCYLEGVWEIAHPCGGEWRRAKFIMKVPYKVSTADGEAAWSHTAVKLSLVMPGSANSIKNNCVRLEGKSCGIEFWGVLFFRSVLYRS